MKISSINNNAFTSKCLIQGSVADLKMISGKIYQNETNAVMFHPSGVVHPRQSYADVIIANDKDVAKVNKFLASDKVWSEGYGKFGTDERAQNITKYLWKNDDLKPLKSKDVLAAMNEGRFDYKNLDIKG